jgi:hypothetical protein
VSGATRTFARGAARTAPLAGLAPLAILLITRGAAAAAGGQPHLEIDTTECPSVSASEIRRIVGIELGEPPFPAAAPGGSWAAPGAAGTSARMKMTCAADASAIVRVRVAGKPETAERPLPLRDFPGDAAPRALALAGIELLATLDATVREKVEATRIVARPPAGHAPPATETATAAPSRTPPPSSAPPSMSFSAAAVRREFLGSAGLGGWGGRLDLVGDSGRRLIVGDLEVIRASHPSALGDAEALLISGAAFAGARAVPAAHVVWSIALGARVGLARLWGTAAQDSGAIATSAWRPWWGPAASTRVTVGNARLAGMASLELGFAARRAEALAGTTTVIAIGGPWLTVAAGLQF